MSHNLEVASTHRPKVRLPGIYLRSEIHSNEASLTAAVNLLLPVIFRRGARLMALHNGYVVELGPGIVAKLLENRARLVRPDEHGAETPSACPTRWAQAIARFLERDLRVQRCDEYPDTAQTREEDDPWNTKTGF